MSDSKDRMTDRKVAASSNKSRDNGILYNGTAEQKIDAWLHTIAQDSQGKNWMSDWVPLLRVRSVRPNDPRPGVTFAFTVQHEHCNNMGTMHGGCTASIFDVCTTLPVAFAMAPGSWEMLGVTRTLNVSYMLPVFVGDEVLIECEILQIGKKLAALRGVMRRMGDNAIVATCEHGKFDAGVKSRA
ncbi:thioesterase superfamily domain-containing protein [Purpureocillium lilacinum]|uniref:Thioesterase superfamily domain-containing protein n=2 Tax=Purpureocillium lilacinum TaxID=33203 RepID=A0A179HHT5_PURLI|nr:thioesterase superfamily domain-containing protein [Purpureocillium lilacinum]OAQ79571.1 thioesterase superfamily domain-containing protein [Purpureocillium lilacinum]OAQ89030.1 thioesterase superfamily domain-containing protein [Purpureocillium lilacinum]